MKPTLFGESLHHHLHHRNPLLRFQLRHIKPGFQVDGQNLLAFDVMLLKHQLPLSIKQDKVSFGAKVSDF